MLSLEAKSEPLKLNAFNVFQKQLEIWFPKARRLFDYPRSASVLTFNKDVR